MGWSYISRPQPKSEFIASLLSPAHWGSTYKILGHDLVGKNLWVAVEYAEDTDYGGKKSDRFITLFLTDCDKGCWGWKDITEHMEPYEVDCPLRLLDLCTPAPAGCEEWRAKVRAYHAKIKALKQATLPGLVIEYGAHQYRLIDKLNSQSWRAARISDGKVFKITPSVLKRSTIIPAAAA